MSDPTLRLENGSIGHIRVTAKPIAGRAIAPEELLAAVRVAVEDGTIEGEVRESYRVQGFAPVLDAPNAKDGTYIVIGPVSDGGSET
jgi:hypothetical protein